MYFFIFILLELSQGYLTNLPQKGTIIISHTSECKDLDRLTRHLDSMKSVYEVLNIEKDRKLSRYLKKRYHGECPLVFVDGIERNFKDFLITLEDEVFNSAWI